jgi:hypothetical protein
MSSPINVAAFNETLCDNKDQLRMRAGDSKIHNNDLFPKQLRSAKVRENRAFRRKTPPSESFYAFNQGRIN